jgi:hypothetical protein
VTCSGYRDTQRLRIQDESKSVIRKFTKDAPLSAPRSLSLSIDLQARDAFFIYYATGPSKCWIFLKQYYHSKDSSDHLTLAIEAVSLAYFWHLCKMSAVCSELFGKRNSNASPAYSDAALETARQRYVLALRMTNRALNSPKEVTKEATLLATLLLDLFEKITNSKSLGNKSWTSHVYGALALVKLRGLEKFHEPSEFHILIRLINHYIASSVANATCPPEELLVLRDYVGNNLNYEEHTLRVSDLTIEYARLRNGFRTGAFSDDEHVRASQELDLKLEALDENMPPAWEYTTTLVEKHSDGIFNHHFDSYPHRNICYARNFLRVGRILLNETLIEGYLASSAGERYKALLGGAFDNIDSMAIKICASVPQYTDCDGPALGRVPVSQNSEPSNLDRVLGHSHTLHHQAECHSLIWPLYVAGRSKAGPNVRPWVIKQLHYIGSHFSIRNAEVVGQILEGDTDVCPWDVYAMLGSYAFNA